MQTPNPSHEIKEPDNRLIDRYNRHLNYLRISITDRCNLRCIYCVPGGCFDKIPQEEILRYEEILRVVNTGIRLGIHKIRITGGEPLVRKGVYRFLRQLTAIPRLRDVSLTTNGILLADHIDKIKAAGIRRINVSLDTLNRDKFLKITGSDGFNRVWKGLQAALDAGFSPIKINVVAIQGVNDDEFEDLARLTFSYPFHVRFIEHMPMGSDPRKDTGFISAARIKERILRIARLLPVESSAIDGPAERYRFENAPGEIGLIRPISRHFCGRCNRLRLTASGQLRTCLLSDTQHDLKRLLRSGAPDEELAAVFLAAVRQKPMQHGLHSDDPARIGAQMCAIGG